MEYFHFFFPFKDLIVLGKLLLIECFICLVLEGGSY